MSSYLTQLSVGELLQQLRARQLIWPAQELEIGQFLRQQEPEELPLYLRGLAGIGAVIAALCFIAFLVVSRLIDFTAPGGLMLWGILFISSAIGSAQVVTNPNKNWQHSFLMQASFCAMLLGKTLLVLGLGEKIKFLQDWRLPVLLLIVTVLIYPLYRFSLDRFLSCLAVLLAIESNLLFNRDLVNSRELGLNLFIILELAIAGLLLINRRIPRTFWPIAYAIVVMLVGQIGLWAMRYQVDDRPLSFVGINIALTISLIGLIGWAAGGMDKLRHGPLMVAAIGAVILGTISAPGLLLAIILMIGGYARHDRLLLGLGSLLLPSFLFIYYYNLQATLWTKSGVLFTSGLVLLVGWGYLNHYLKVSND
jgi:uncharacterized membrane protein